MPEQERVYSSREERHTSRSESIAHQPVADIDDIGTDSRYSSGERSTTGRNNRMARGIRPRTGKAAD